MRNQAAPSSAPTSIGGLVLGSQVARPGIGEVVVLVALGRSVADQRWFSRFSETSAGRIHDRESDYYQDEANAFFQNCYHLKDWLKNDPATEALAKPDVEAFIRGSLNLSLCADIANGSKHLKLTTPKVDSGTRMGKRHFALNLGHSRTTLSAKYEIAAGGKTYDAFAVAKACMDDWESYLKGKGLLSRDA